MKKRDCFTISDEIFKIGDCVEVLPGSEEPEPYVAKIKEIKKRKCLVQWYYRPEDTDLGRMRFHGKLELLMSDHMDLIDQTTIMNRCHVLKMEDYVKLEIIECDIYYYRFFYMPLDGSIYPDEVPVYCICELPNNPDLTMIGCDKCNDWFHPKCLELSDKEFKKIIMAKEYICPRCEGKIPCGDSSNGRVEAPKTPVKNG